MYDDLLRTLTNPQRKPRYAAWAASRLTIIVLACISAASCSRFGGDLERECIVSRVIDGDTITCLDIRERIRLAELDAAEWDGPGQHGRLQAFCVADLLGGRVLAIRILGQDRYGRLLVNLDKELTSKIMDRCQIARWTKGTTLRPLAR